MSSIVLCHQGTNRSGFTDVRLALNDSFVQSEQKVFLHVTEINDQ